MDQYTDSQAKAAVVAAAAAAAAVVPAAAAVPAAVVPPPLPLAALPQQPQQEQPPQPQQEQPPQPQQELLPQPQQELPQPAELLPLPPPELLPNELAEMALADRVYVFPYATLAQRKKLTTTFDRLLRVQVDVKEKSRIFEFHGGFDLYTSWSEEDLDNLRSDSSATKVMQAMDDADRKILNLMFALSGRAEKEADAALETHLETDHILELQMWAAAMVEVEARVPRGDGFTVMQINFLINEVVNARANLMYTLRKINRAKCAIVKKFLASYSYGQGGNDKSIYNTSVVNARATDSERVIRQLFPRPPGSAEPEPADDDRIVDRVDAAMHNVYNEHVRVLLVEEFDNEMAWSLKEKKTFNMLAMVLGDMLLRMWMV